ncbi:GNAT family N-acetyltransferase [Virgibacillus kekensis]|uniref:GNAT family N-acetyltransferase n=1 Tax=Virgibacillus kekensis TaxID=202261 RepID=A0ABV9DN00_9BACI
MTKNIVINKMVKEDWADVRDIFIEGIETRNATFETEAPSWEIWDAGHFEECRLVVREGEKVIGWAALSPISDRSAHRGVAEVSIYLSSLSIGKGLGTELLQKLVECSENKGFWTLQTSIFPENQSSIRLHKKCGFAVVGVRKRLGMLDGEWRDVVILERRSKVVGL